MGVRGQVPKADAVNKTRPRHDQSLLPLGGRKGRVPKPPLPLDGPALDLWNELWRTPMAVRWQPLDTGLVRICRLATNPATYEDPRVLAELRQLEDRFGLSAEARLKLRWQLVEEQERPRTGVGEVVALPSRRAREVT